MDLGARRCWFLATVGRCAVAGQLAPGWVTVTLEAGGGPAGGGALVTPARAASWPCPEYRAGGLPAEDSPANGGGDGCGCRQCLDSGRCLRGRAVGRAAARQVPGRWGIVLGRAGLPAAGRFPVHTRNWSGLESLAGRCLLRAACGRVPEKEPGTVS